MKKTLGLGFCAVAALALTMGGCSKNSDEGCSGGDKACCKDGAKSDGKCCKDAAKDGKDMTKPAN